MTGPLPHLAFVATTDLAGIARGRAVPEARLDKVAARGVGWVPANLCITPFGSIPDPNPWGSSGDLLLVPDMAARYRTNATGAEAAFDLIAGDLRDLDGAPWEACPRQFLRSALAALKAATGLTMIASFEHEFQAIDHGWPDAHPFGLSALRRAGSFAPRLIAALDEAGIEPELVFAEYGRDQFEVTCGPTDALAAADRAVALREITREIARLAGWHASFAPKTAPEAVGNGVHIHFSFLDAAGSPMAHAPEQPGGLSPVAGRFCAGVLRHLPALTALTVPSVPSFLRLTPHSWSAAYTWLGAQEREATLRLCPLSKHGGGDPARQFNIEYRAADATANPYLALGAIVRAGLDGIERALPTPPLIAADPAGMTEDERKRLNLARLPQTLAEALVALEADADVAGWLGPSLLASHVAVKREEIRHLADRSAEEACFLYRTLY